MGIDEQFGDMAEQAVDKVGGPERAKEHLGTAADAANSATGGRYEEHVDKGEMAAGNAIDGLSQGRDR
jgi:predicted butyrate kinase (DUF1464 family)